MRDPLQLLPGMHSSPPSTGVPLIDPVVQASRHVARSNQRRRGDARRTRLQGVIHGPV